MRTVLRIWGLAKPYWRQLTIAYVSLLAGMALDLTLPRVLQNTIDIGIAGKRPQYMVTAGLIVLGIAVFKALLSFGQRYFSEWLAFRIAYDLKNKLYRHIEYLSFSFHDSAQTGELMDAHARMLAEAEREVLTQAFTLAEGNQAKAARWLGFSRFTLREKLKQLGLHPDSTEAGPEAEG